MQTRGHDLTTSLGLLILRVGFGGYLITHGWGKLQMLLDGKFAEFVDPIGVGSTASLVLIVLAEVVCAALVLIGLGTRLAALPVVIAMGVAAFVVHTNDPWTMGAGASKEPALLYLSAYLTVLLTGAGRFSIDALFRKGADREAASS